MTAPLRASVYAHLVSLNDSPSALREFPLVREASFAIVIGRSPDDAQLVLDDEQVSRRHACIECNGAEFVLIDLGSRNGTYLNGEKIAEPRVLKHGDVIGLRKLNRAFRFDVVKITKPWIGVLTRDDGTGIFRVGQSEVRLSTLERQLLNVLFDGAGQFVSRKDIAKAVYDEALYDPDRDKQRIEKLVSRLREKLEDMDEEKRWVESDHEYGYKLNAGDVS
ncbi:MAG: FHA domain-containing protein [Anaerolineae bacterium]|nr:FHA domain-containing protein [Anaerolineae bacterium]